MPRPRPSGDRNHERDDVQSQDDRIPSGTRRALGRFGWEGEPSQKTEASKSMTRAKNRAEKEQAEADAKKREIINAAEASSLLLDRLANAEYDPESKLITDRRRVSAIDLCANTIVAAMAQRDDENSPTKLALEATKQYFNILLSPKILEVARSRANEGASSMLYGQIQRAADALAEEKAEQYRKEMQFKDTEGSAP